MNPNNRVFGRVGARELTAEELQKVGGAIQTAGVCTIINRSAFNDGECS
jgi:hypothetical protein